MDESMNSVHSISAMDISPASSPRTAVNPLPSNPIVLNAFQHQQQSLSNMLFNSPSLNKNPFVDDGDLNSRSFLYSTVLNENTDMIIPPVVIPDESNQIRQRIITTEPIVSPTPTVPKTTTTTGQSSKKFLFYIPLIVGIIYLLFLRGHSVVSQPRQSNWHNASEYLTKNLLGQEQALEQFKQTMTTHKNFSVVLIEVKTKGKTLIKLIFIPGTNWHWQIVFSIVTGKIHSNNFNIN